MKLGMVFEGGANRTVFSCGVMDKFLEENIMPDYYIGVSAGMAYGLSYLSGQKGRNLELMEKYMADKRYMGMRHLLNRKEHAYYNTKFVFEEVPNELLPLDYDALARFPGEIEAAVTNIHTGKEGSADRNLFTADSFSAGKDRQTLLSGRRTCRFGSL